MTAKLHGVYEYNKTRYGGNDAMRKLIHTVTIAALPLLALSTTT